MVTNLRTYLKEGFSYVGLEVTETQQGEAYFLLELKKTKNELRITNKESLPNLESLPGIIQKKTPIFLCINTSDILSKKIDGISTSNPEAIVHQAFPNLDLNNFYFEIAQHATEPIVTISRKEPIASLLKRFIDLGIKISKFSLGVSAIENLIPYLEVDSVQVSNAQLQISEKVIATISTQENVTEQQLTINGLDLSSNYLLSFSQILGNLNAQLSISNFEELTETLKWEFKNYRIFNQVLKYALVFFVGLLLVNFLVYNFYHEKVGELNASMAATSSKKDALSLLAESVQLKQERLETLSNSSNSKATYYLDLFAQHIPNSILLSEIKYQPLLKPLREAKPIILEERTFLVSGISKDVNNFSFWIEELEKYDWVQSVETLDYDYISQNTSNFLIEIELHENK